MLNELLLASQLNTQLNPEKLIEEGQAKKTEQVQRVAYKPENKKFPSFLEGERKRIIKEKMLDTGFEVYPKLSIPALDLKRYSKIEPIGLEFKDSRCSGTIFTQIHNGKEYKYMFNIGHCWSDDLLIKFENNIQILSTPKFNFENSNTLDPAIAIPLEIVQRASQDVNIVSLVEHVTDPRVVQLMQGYNTSSHCDISNPVDFYNLNMITRDDNPNQPENAFLNGVDGVTVKPGQSGSLVSVEGVRKVNEINLSCLNPKMITSHARFGMNIRLIPNFFSPQFKGNFTNMSFNQQVTLLKRKNSIAIPPRYIQSTDILKSAGYIDTNSLDGGIINTENELYSLAERKVLSPDQQLQMLTIPSKNVKSVIFKMNGKKYKITRSADKTQPDNIVTLEN